MKSHRRRSPRITPEATVGIAWFTPEEWMKLTAVVPDRSQLDDTFEEWERSANEALRTIESSGVTVKRVMVEVDALLAWCNERGRPVNGASRADYVAHVMRAGK